MVHVPVHDQDPLQPSLESLAGTKSDVVEVAVATGLEDNNYLIKKVFFDCTWSLRAWWPGGLTSDMPFFISPEITALTRSMVPPAALVAASHTLGCR